MSNVSVQGEQADSLKRTHEYRNTIDQKLVSGYIAIDAFEEFMMKQGLKPSTITDRTKCLRTFAKRKNILNPEDAISLLLVSNWSDNTKSKRVDDLASFYAFRKITWTPPRYRKVWKIPFLPMDSEIEQLIDEIEHGTRYGKKYATALRFAKDTGARLGELWQVEWTDFDLERSLVNIGKPEKNSDARQLKISSKLVSMLNTLPRRSTYVFRNPSSDSGKSLKDFSRTFSKQRKRAAEKLNNPRLLRISFKTLRHYKATYEYRRTRDIVHVQHVLGHRNIKNTLVYIHLVNDDDSCEYVSKAASTVAEARQFIESGFDYVTDIEGQKLFRKRK